MAVVGNSAGNLRRQAWRDLESAEQRQNADCFGGQAKTRAHGILHNTHLDHRHGIAMRQWLECYA